MSPKRLSKGENAMTLASLQMWPPPGVVQKGGSQGGFMVSYLVSYFEQKRRHVQVTEEEEKKK